MGEVYFGIPVPLARALVEALGLGLAIETGTHLGDSAATLSEMVDHVWTVELSHEYVLRARARYGDREAITFLEGSSPAVLVGLAPSVDRPALYWLDAHWCQADTAGYEAQCPLLAEIEALEQSPTAAQSVILIDDARFFLGRPWPSSYRRSDWPTFMEIADRLRARHPRYVTTLMDVIIAGPPRAQAAVESFWRAKLLADLERRQARAGHAAEVLRTQVRAAKERGSQSGPELRRPLT